MIYLQNYVATLFLYMKEEEDRNETKSLFNFVPVII